MNKNKNISLISSFKKNKYYTLSVKKQKNNKKSINYNKRGIKIFQTFNQSSLALSCEPEEKKIKMSLIRMEKKPVNIGILNYKLGRKYNYIKKQKLNGGNNQLSFSDISKNKIFESNKEIYFKNIFNGINQNNNNNNFIIKRRKIDFVSPINYPMNINKKTKIVKNSYIKVNNPNKYKTISTKYHSFLNFSKKNKNIAEEPNSYFETLSSKYYNNKIEKMNQSKYNNKLFNNEEINKVEFPKFYSIKRNKKYLDTEISSNSDNINLEKKQNISNTPLSKRINFIDIFKSFNYSKKSDENLAIIVLKIKDNSLNKIGNHGNRPINKKENKIDLTLENLPLNKCKYYKNNLGVKYSKIPYVI